MRSYQEYPVHAALAGLVVCTWVDPAAAQRHPVLPDACIDIVWDGAELHVAGPDTGPAPLPSQATFVGLRFQPGAAPGALGVAASELLDRRVALRDLWGQPADELAERLAADPAHAPRLLEQALLARQAVGSARPPDPLVRQVVRELSRRTSRAQDVETLARRLDVSERTLRRHCLGGLGYGPKTLDRVLRFRRALRLLRSGVALVETAQVAGFADQAHLSHELLRLAGAAPGRLSRLPDLVISANGCN